MSRPLHSAWAGRIQVLTSSFGAAHSGRHIIRTFFRAMRLCGACWQTMLVRTACLEGNWLKKLSIRSWSHALRCPEATRCFPFLSVQLLALPLKPGDSANMGAQEALAAFSQAVITAYENGYSVPSMSLELSSCLQQTLGRPLQVPCPPRLPFCCRMLPTTSANYSRAVTGR